MLGLGLVLYLASVFRRFCEVSVGLVGLATMISVAGLLEVGQGCLSVFVSRLFVMT